jgi:hypothetical protein
MVLFGMGCKYIISLLKIMVFPQLRFQVTSEHRCNIYFETGLNFESSEAIFLLRATRFTIDRFSWYLCTTKM